MLRLFYERNQVAICLVLAVLLASGGVYNYMNGMRAEVWLNAGLSAVALMFAFIGIRRKRKERQKTE
ncbi:hypothetical protein [Bhargavaea beijingensis]|uniref:PEP-CTERM protein-sorting domain-containing protein n=1 Tax=Bhargavaea beijingensis TaxID=426756 RepID=A0ABX9ZDM6_9BACL|nr:hypothetical protein [Bhargavaea beijingensis]RSK31947.1 hypothetical protein EJA12_08160 [Bhargavaea beijingensis]